MKQSIKSTYDSREIGGPYSVTTQVGDKMLPVTAGLLDPFVRHTVHISLGDLLRGLWKALVSRRRMFVVEVVVGAPLWLMDDVMELDENQLVPGRSRREEFNGEMNVALAKLGADAA